MELHSASATLDLDVGGTTSFGTPTDMDLTEKTARVDSSGLDFVFDEAMPGLDGASAAPTVETPRPADAGTVAPTIETPRVKVESGGDTQELTVDRLGLDIDAVRSLEALDTDDSLSLPRPVKVEDTVETPGAPRGGRSLLDDDQEGGTDLLNSTALMRMAENTPLGEGADGDEAVVDLSEVTGELQGLDFPLSEAGIKPTPRGYDSFEQPTQSEVGTKLDLARAYMDMGDPEGARSILEEVLQEGNPTQQQEARRLISSLPA
jgi:pilus assembly protein FimV